jgi:hypothetical protein
MAIPVKAAPILDRRCHCGADGVFGYRNEDGAMDWYCADHRRGQWYADACITKDVATLAAVHAPDGPPDLQTLIETAGRRYAQSIGDTYDPNPLTRPPHQGGDQHVTEAEWREFDRAMAAWQVQRREKFREVK